MENIILDPSDKIDPDIVITRDYQFSGYQLPKIQLDGTGPNYYVVTVHPYYTTQPAFWTKPYYQWSPMRTSSEESINAAVNIPQNLPPTSFQAGSSSSSKLFKMLPI